MPGRVRFNFLNNLKRTERELMKFLSSVCPGLTPTDCREGTGYATVSFAGNDDVNKLLKPDVIEKLKEQYSISPQPQEIESNTSTQLASCVLR